MCGDSQNPGAGYGCVSKPWVPTLGEDKATFYDRLSVWFIGGLKSLTPIVVLGSTAHPAIRFPFFASNT